MNNAPTVAVVILNWNGRHYLQQFLPSVLASGYAGMEVVVADNASTDDSLAWLQEHHPHVRVISLAQNFGFAKGYNEALKQVQADYYVILNSDVEVQPGWLNPMVELLEKDPKIAACQPKILSYHNRQLFEYAGGAGGWMDKYGYPFAKGRVFDICEEDRGQYDQCEPVFWASGAALFIRAAVFHEAGGFDEYFFAHQEEIDLCWRIQLAGYKIYSCPSSVVYHVGGGTLPKGNSLKTFLNFRNNRIMLHKNLTFWQKLWIMPARNLLDAMTAFKGLFSGDVGYFKAVIRADIAFKKWWLFHQRKSTFPASRKGQVYGYLNKNIIWLHFVKKLKFFRQIKKKTQ